MKNSGYIKRDLFKRKTWLSSMFWYDGKHYLDLKYNLNSYQAIIFVRNNYRRLLYMVHGTFSQ